MRRVARQESDTRLTKRSFFYKTEIKKGEWDDSVLQSAPDFLYRGLQKHCWSDDFDVLYRQDSGSVDVPYSEDGRNHQSEHSQSRGRHGVGRHHH